MEERKLYLWRVSHPVHGEIEVEASDRYFAVTKAAHEWGQRWSTIARDCKAKRLGEVSWKISMTVQAPRKDRKKGGRKRE